jgi:hypothetical protein
MVPAAAVGPGPAAPCHVLLPPSLPKVAGGVGWQGAAAGGVRGASLAVAAVPVLEAVQRHWHSGPSTGNNARAACEVFNRALPVRGALSLMEVMEAAYSEPRRQWAGTGRSSAAAAAATCPGPTQPPPPAPDPGSRGRRAAGDGFEQWIGTPGVRVGSNCMRDRDGTGEGWPCPTGPGEGSEEGPLPPRRRGCERRGERRTPHGHKPQQGWSQGSLHAVPCTCTSGTRTKS